MPLQNFISATLKVLSFVFNNTFLSFNLSPSISSKTCLPGVVWDQNGENEEKNNPEHPGGNIVIYSRGS